MIWLNLTKDLHNFINFFLVAFGGTRHTSRVELKVHVYSRVLCPGNVCASREQTRAVMLLEMCLVDVAFGGSTCLLIFDQGETAQNILEIPTVLEQVICSGDGACGIQSGTTGFYVHRPDNPPSQIRGADSESPTRNL